MPMIWKRSIKDPTSRALYPELVDKFVEVPAVSHRIDYDHPKGAIIKELPTGERIHKYGDGPWLDGHGRVLPDQPTN